MKRFAGLLTPAYKTKRVLFLAASGTQILDVTGPFQIFVRASDILRRQNPKSPAAYQVEVVSTTGERVIRTSCGLDLMGAHGFRSVRGSVDTLLVAGGSGMERACEHRALVKWLQQKVRITRRFGSICTGAFLLAKAGLLNGKKVTTHWQWCEELARDYPQVVVDPDPIFVRDGCLYTSAGVTAGMDLALALVEEDFNSELALEVAREMVLYLRRPGGQSQFSAALSLQFSDRRPIQRLHSWVMEHLADPLPIEVLARQLAMSPRNFARVFVGETGTTPARYIERLRIEAACRRLEESEVSLDEVANKCGFGSVESMRRVFLRLRGVTPGQYRARFKRNSPTKSRLPNSSKTFSHRM